MTFRRISLLLFVVLMTLVLGSTAFANTATLSNDYLNQASYLSVNGSTNFTAVMRDSYDDSVHSGLQLYRPINANSGFEPPEFIGYSAVPEPGSLTLLGTGLLCLAALIRRKLNKA
jgi:hypothetical protein